MLSLSVSIAWSLKTIPSLGCHVDHIISVKHEGSTTLDNLAYACVVCNRQKGSDLGSIDWKTRKLSSIFSILAWISGQRTFLYREPRLLLAPLLETSLFVFLASTAIVKSSSGKRS